MYYVVQPGIKVGDFGAAPLNVGRVILELLDRGMIRSHDPPHRPTADELQKLRPLLLNEISDAVFGESLRWLVLYLQLQEGLGDGLGGAVEVETAALLNRLITSLLGDAPTKSPPDLRRIVRFSVSTDVNDASFIIRFQPEGRPERRIPKLSSEALSAILSLRRSFRFFVFDTRTKRILATDNLLE